MKLIKTINASDIERSKTYRVSIDLVPKAMKHLQEEGYYYFTVNFVSNIEDGIMIEDFNNKLWKIPLSQYVTEIGY